MEREAGGMLLLAMGSFDEKVLSCKMAWGLGVSSA